MAPTVNANVYMLRAGEWFRFHPPLVVPDGVYWIAPNLWASDGALEIRGPWQWDGNSFKLALGPLIVGVHDGPLTTDGVPAGKWPSAGHDIMYERIRELARLCKVSVWAVRKAADVWFRDEWLRQVAKVEDERVRRSWSRRVRYEYYPAVRIFGALMVARRLMQQKERSAVHTDAPRK